MSGVLTQVQEQIATLLRHKTTKAVTVDVDSLLTQLVSEDQATAASITIAKALNDKYYIARDNVSAFEAIIPVVKELSSVAIWYAVNFDGKYRDNQTLHSLVVQLMFKVSQFFSLASTRSIDTELDNYTECSKWLDKVKNYIFENNLVNTLDHAVWHNLMGGHMARGHVMQENAGNRLHYPHEAVEHFEAAVRILYQEQNYKLHNPEHVQLRHNLMCLASVTMMEAMNKVLIHGYSSDALWEELALACFNAQKIVDALTDEVLVVAKKVNIDDQETTVIEPNYYRQAGREQTRAYIFLMRGDLVAACSAIDRAAELMQRSIDKEKSAAYGQLSAILNDQTRMHLALAESSNLRSLDLFKQGIEKMYADEAQLLYADQTSSKFFDVYEAVSRHPIPTPQQQAPMANDYQMLAIRRFLAAETAAHAAKSSYWEQAKSYMPTLSWDRARSLTRSERTAIAVSAVVGSAMALKLARM